MDEIYVSLLSLFRPWLQTDAGRLDAELVHLAVACAVALCSGVIAFVGWAVRFVIGRAVSRWDEERKEIHARFHELEQRLSALER